MFPYPAGQPLIVADCHTPSSTGSICSLIRSNVPGKFICLNPCKSAIVDSVKHVGSVRGDYAFSSRPPMSSVKPNFDPHFKMAQGATEVPWDVAELPQAHEPSKFSIQNLMTKPKPSNQASCWDRYANSHSPLCSKFESTLKLMFQGFRSDGW